jgi:cation:H+ antiporter
MSETLLELLTGRGLGVALGAFVIVGVAVFLVASRLARHADAIADATGLGRVWIGALLLAASTSLPELVTDVNAALLGAIDIGVGDLMGSTLANLLILAVLDLVYRKRRILHEASLHHLLLGSLAVLLTALAGAAISSGGWGRIGHVGVETVLILVLYAIGMRAVFYHGPQTVPPEQLELGETGETVLRRGLAGFGIAAAGLLLTAPLLVISAEAVAIEGDLTQSFVGTLLVGFTTSFPEMAATAAAARMGAVDLAVGNIFGSSAFNMSVLFAMDVAYVHGPLLAGVAPVAAMTAHLAILTLGFAMLAMFSRDSRRALPVRLESLMIVATYAGAAWLLGRG